jgi:hypothetical protein
MKKLMITLLRFLISYKSLLCSGVLDFLHIVLPETTDIPYTSASVSISISASTSTSTSTCTWTLDLNFNGGIGGFTSVRVIQCYPPRPRVHIRPRPRPSSLTSTSRPRIVWYGIVWNTLPFDRPTMPPPEYVLILRAYIDRLRSCDYAVGMMTSRRWSMVMVSGMVMVMKTGIYLWGSGMTLYCRTARSPRRIVMIVSTTSFFVPVPIPTYLPTYLYRNFNPNACLDLDLHLVARRSSTFALFTLRTFGLVHTFLTLTRPRWPFAI